MTNFVRIYLRALLCPTIVILKIYLLFTTITIVLFTHVSDLLHLRNLELPWILHNALRQAQDSA